MAIDFNKWNEEFGGKDAVEALKNAKDNDFTELPDGTYVCAIEKMELGESKDGKPMIKVQFRIKEGKHKKQCLFYNQVFCKSANGSGFPIKKGLEFLRSLNIFDVKDVDFDGDYEKFNDLLLDMAEEGADFYYEIQKSKDGEYTRLECTDTFETL